MPKVTFKQPSRTAEVLAALQASLSTNEVRAASDPSFEVQILQTGVLPIDVLLHGGLARGRFTLITGEFSTLKSYITLRAAAATQAMGGLAAIIDTEKAFDPSWAKALGVNTDDLILMQPVVGEDALGIAEALIQDHDLDLLVWDSIASTLTNEQASKQAAESDKVATLARFINRAMQRLNAINSKTALLVVNQLRTKIGVTYGTPVSFPGGKAQEFYAAQHIFMRRNERLREDTQHWRLGAKKTTKHTSHVVFEAELAKSKVGGPPFGSVTILWDPAAGSVDELAFAVDAGLDLGVVQVNDKGSMFTFGSVTAAKGKRFMNALAANPDEGRALMTAVFKAACPHLSIWGSPSAKTAR